MIGQDGHARGAPRTFLGRLRGDVRGNTLAMMAIALIPLCALSGSAIDMGRLYMVKVRLQQACDAGALAGRKFMADSNDATLDANAADKAATFFRNNFRSGWMQTSAVSFTPTKTSDKQVAGKAEATVPMSIMKMFQLPDQTIKVSCEARYDLADSDIMFVLDTTGSMACAPADASCSQANLSYTRNDGTTGYYVQEKSDSKLQALRDAVQDFDSTMRANADPSTHIRYGFVTYSSTVNVGKLIPSQYLVNTTWKYQTRRVIGEAKSGSATAVTLTGYNAGNCSSANARYPASGWYTDSTAYYITGAAWSSGGSGNCKGTRQNYIPIWRYQQWPLDISQYVTGVAVPNPARLDGSTATWQGCIEERDTTTASTFDIDNLPPDLNPDLIPSSDATKWRPMWPNVEWDRNNSSYDNATSTYYEDTSANRDAYFYGSSTYNAAGYYSCGMPARRLSVMTASDVQNYVYNNDFKALGGTYHDVGMIWGVRMLSPDGIFGSDTAAWPGRNPPSRNIVFMTDGQMAPSTSIYSLYGIEDTGFDSRVTGGSVSTDYDKHVARFLAECRYAKDHLNIAIYVVALGTDLNDDLKSCSSGNGFAYTATSKPQLQAAFKAIAQQVAMLRVSK
ncbi:TadE/TadG family type IV pilus assembly protein [uncultured Sphingomonas sp.]|uniref:TadE/TadG family type IV pilus assembly protein n=1 Tax=uncultured Sphingomonas sp. TaxID=158754 RepID=UPI0035CC919C